MALFGRRNVVSMLFVGFFLLLYSDNVFSYDGELPEYGINLDYVTYYMSQIPFMNAANLSNDWVRVNGSEGIWHNTDYPLDVDENGYPRSLPENWVVYNFVYMGTELPAGKYRLRWQGTGKVEFSGSSKLSLVEENEQEKTYSLSEPAKGFKLYIKETDPNGTGDYVRDITLELPGYDTVETRFYPPFLEDLRHFGLIRFLDWTQVNGNTHLQQWPDRNTVDDHFWGNKGGVPYEVMVELCNELHADMWITIPHLVDDEYVTKLAQVIYFGSDGVEPYTSTTANPVHAPLDSDLRVWIQYSNEVWSPGPPGPEQHHYARDTLRARYGLSSIGAAYAARAVEMWDIFESVMGGTQRMVRVLGGRSGSPHWMEQGLLSARGKADVVAVAAYLGGDVASGQKLTNYIADQNYQVPKSEVFDAIRENVETDMRDKMAVGYRAAKANGLEFVLYEGGPGMTGEEDPKLTDYLIDLHRDTGWISVYNSFLEMLYQEGARTYTAYEYTRGPNKYGCFGHKEYQSQPLGDRNTPGSAHKFRTLVEWIESPRPAKKHYPIDTIVIDDADRSFYAKSFICGQDWGEGFYGDGWCFSDAGLDKSGYAIWYPYLNGREGTYDIQLWKGTGAVNNQPFTIFHADGETVVEVDFSAHTSGEFFSIGTFEMTNDSYLKSVDSFEPEGNSRAVLDAARLIPVDVNSIRVSAPSASEVSPRFNVRNGLLTIAGINKGEIKVYDGSGRAVYAADVVSRDAVVTRSLPTGWYMVSIKDAETGRRVTKSILLVTP